MASILKLNAVTSGINFESLLETTTPGEEAQSLDIGENAENVFVITKTSLRIYSK